MYMLLVGGLEHEWIIFHILGIIIPADFHIFQRGRYTTNQVGYLPCTHLTVVSPGGPALCFRGVPPMELASSDLQSAVIPWCIPASKR